jgi:phage terminase large subunit-like protein
MTVATRVKVADPVTDYARAVVARKIVAGPYVRAACKRHLDDLAAWKRGERGLIWNLEEANRVIALIGSMPLPDGTPFIVQPSQAFIAGSVFGWYLPGDVRRFRTAFVEEGKGNGKTAFAARLGIILTAADGKHAAEVYTAGVTRDQAHYLWNDALRVVEASETLRGVFEMQAHNLSVPATDSYMRPVSSEARSLDQKRVHAALVDEIHEHATPLVVEKMRAGTKGDERALIFEITNSGYDRHSICWQHHTYSIAVVTGAVQNDSWFAYVCALDEGDKWTDEKVWPKANPLLDVTISRRYLREQVQEAMDMPAKAALVQRLNFCVWTEASAGAIEMSKWDQGNVPPQIEAGEEVYGGLDLSTTTDLSAAIFLRESDGWLDVICKFWCPKEGIAMRSRRDRVPYQLWAEQGYLIATEGNVVDYASIRRAISGYYVADGVVCHDPDCIADTFHIRELAYDRWNATQLVTQLGDDGANMVPIGQGYASMSAPTKDWLARVASAKVRHGGNPILRWMAANLVVTQDPAGNLKPDKDKSTERIDGQVAAIMALARLTAPHDPEASAPGFTAYWEAEYQRRLAESKGGR